MTKPIQDHHIIPDLRTKAMVNNLQNDLSIYESAHGLPKVELFGLSNKDKEEFHDMPRMVTLLEAAELTGLSYSALRNMCLQNKIIHIRVGKKYMLNKEKLKDYLDRKMEISFPA